jgi:mannosyltransferase
VVNHRWLTRDEGVLSLTALSLVLGLGLLTFGYGLDAESLWYDEAFSLQAVSGNNRSFLRLIIDREPFAALYYGLLRIWIALGESEFMLRLPSAIFALGTLGVVYATAKRLYGLPTALLAGVLLSLNFFMVRYAQEARAYALTALLVAASTYLIIRVAEQPTSRRWLAYSVTAILAIYAHFLAAFAVAGQLAAAYLHRRVPKRWWLASAFVIGLTVVPLAWLIASSSVERSWILPVSFERTVRSVQHLAGGSYPDAGLAGTILLWAAFAAVGLAAFAAVRRGESWPTLLLLLCFAGPIVLIALLSLVEPMFVPRYLIVALPALTILIAAGLNAIRPRLVAAGAALAIIALTAQGTLSWHGSYHKPDWRNAVSALVEQADEEDVIILVPPFEHRPYTYYAERLGAPTDIARLPVDPDAAEEYVREVIAPEHGRLWLIQRLPLRNLDAIEKLGDHYEVTAESTFHRLRITEYVRPVSREAGEAD